MLVCKDKRGWTLGALALLVALLALASAPAGAAGVTYRASDGEAQSTPATVTLDVQTPPMVSLATDRASGVEGSTLVFTATASDRDGTVEEYRYTIDGQVVQTGASARLGKRWVM